MPPKRPRAARPPSPKEPRAALVDIGRERPLWSFGWLDLDAPWSWRDLGGATLGQVLTRLGHLETMAWSQILGDRDHFVPVDRLAPDARRRLADIKRDDVDELLSLHIDGRARIWGIRVGQVLRILWWDADHAVCPSPKKHT